ncbi:MAG: PP2C family protein-serine/threonine phosphatase [Vicinamibacterales bacterium]
MTRRDRHGRRGGFRGFLSDYTRDLTSDDVRRLFTRDAVDAYRFFSKGLDPDALALKSWPGRIWTRVRLVVLAFAFKLSPPRRLVFGLGLLLTLLGLLQSCQGVQTARLPPGVGVPAPDWGPGVFWMLLGFLLTNLLVLVEVYDRLSLKNDLDIAREIQLAMLPQSTWETAGALAYGVTRPANTVGGDFYDIIPRDNGRVIVALGDVAGKGSPAALLMALLLAMFRTLLDERLGLAALAERLNLQVRRHAPASRFITLFFGEYDPSTGILVYVNAGHTPPLLRRAADESCERLAGGSVALGMFEGSRYETSTVVLSPGDVLVLYSDGVTEAEDPQGHPFEEAGLERVVASRADAPPKEIADGVFRAVESFTDLARLADDLTILVLRRI